MDILLQTIISEFSIKAPKDPKNPLQFDLTTIDGVAAIFAIFAKRRFGSSGPHSFKLLQRDGGPFASPHSYGPN